MRALALLGLLSLSVPARAEVGLGGHVKGFLFQQLGDPWQLDRAGARLQVALRGGYKELLAFYAAVDFELDSRLLTSDQPVSRGEGLDVYPVEAYLQLTKGPLEVKVGQQFVFWGRTTWVNPTDVITPWDYPDMASEIEDYRMAPVAARVNWYIKDELMLDLVWVPIFRPHRVGSMVPAQMGGLPVEEGEPQLPDHHPQNGEFGLRLSHSISSLALDWAVAAYKGFEKLPVLVIAPRLPAGGGPPTGLVATRRYDPLWMVGLDLAKAWGPVVLKGEGALLITDDWSGQDPQVRNSRVELVAGVDYVWSDNLTLGAQYIGDYLINRHRAVEILAQRRLTGADPPFLQERYAHAVSLRVDLKIFDELGAQLIGVYSGTYNDFFLLGFVYWEIADALKAYAGGVGFGGADEHTPLGRQQSSSRLFAELKYSF